jgi:small subunit ribosomal protein S1
MLEQLVKALPIYTEGSIVKGRIIEKRSKEILVDIGYKSEGVIALNEFEDGDTLAVGDEVEVFLEDLENDNGVIVLSKEKAAQKQNWDKIVKTFNEGGVIDGKVKAVVKGGLMLTVGVEAFLPSSQIDVAPPKNLRESSRRNAPRSARSSSRASRRAVWSRAP